MKKLFSGWTLSHVLCTLAFVAGIGWAVSQYLVGRTVNMQLLVSSLPLLLLAAERMVSFYKAPPGDPETALQEGEKALTVNAVNADVTVVKPRGFVTTRVAGLMALTGLLALIVMMPLRHKPQAEAAPQAAAVVVTHAVSGVGQGCGFFSSNSSTVTTNLAQIGQCVLDAIMAGAVDPPAVLAACAGATLQIIVSVIEAALNYYTSPATDGGASGAAPGQVCGQGPPPYANLPTCVTPDFIAKLKTHHELAKARIAAANAGH